MELSETARLTGGSDLRGNKRRRSASEDGVVTRPVELTSSAGDSSAGPRDGVDVVDGSLRSVLFPKKGTLESSRASYASKVSKSSSSKDSVTLFPSSEASGWVKVCQKSKYAHKPKKVIFGNGSSSSDKLAAAPKIGKFYAGLWHPNTTKDDLVDHLKSLGVNVSVCEYVRTKGTHTVLFGLNVILKKSVEPSNWPKGILLKRWWEPRNISQNKLTEGPKILVSNTI